MLLGCLIRSVLRFLELFLHEVQRGTQRQVCFLNDMAINTAWLQGACTVNALTLSFSISPKCWFTTSRLTWIVSSLLAEVDLDRRRGFGFLFALEAPSRSMASVLAVLDLRCRRFFGLRAPGSDSPAF